MYINPLLLFSLCFVITISNAQRRWSNYPPNNDLSNSLGSGSPSCRMSERLPDRRCCGKNGGPYEVDDPFRIIGGQNTDLYLYPWLALLDYRPQPNGFTSFCGGSLITGRLVLTAAHCTKPHDRPVSVRLGEYDSTNSGPDCISMPNGVQCTNGHISIPISIIYRHSSFDDSPSSNHQYDIAFLYLSRMAPYTDFIRPVCLPSYDVTQDPPPNLTLYAAGWGTVHQTRRSIYDNITNIYEYVKKHVDLPHVPLEACRRRWPNVGASQICAGGDGNKATCMGDSGGPLMHYRNGAFELVGIVSYGYEVCAMRGTPGVYTKVHAYKAMAEMVINLTLGNAGVGYSGTANVNADNDASNFITYNSLEDS